ncbi:hypothetical protein EUGRSUZ_K01778 [Eucalyptus grandis]|uniref:Uncharacterized protein n=2 Tax=Eucalyptus grandis TaxID=71139 RepID=A0ACC3IUC1_EUCGR|nr:hypothetical protein EUGRSUZ_K01778 [Eucalyptus grandis]
MINSTAHAWIDLIHLRRHTSERGGEEEEDIFSHIYFIMIDLLIILFYIAGLMNICLHTLGTRSRKHIHWWLYNEKEQRKHLLHGYGDCS